MHKGILIAIEGIDGSGKDSQAQRLEELDLRPRPQCLPFLFSDLHHAVGKGHPASLN